MTMSKELSDELERSYVEGKTVIDLLGNIKNKNILDAGCGHGEWAQLFAYRRASVVGVDKVRKDILEIEEAKFKFVLGDLANIPYSDAYFDVVFNRFVLSYVEDINLLIREFSRVLKKDGFLLLVDTHLPRGFREDETKRTKFSGYKHSFVKVIQACKKNGLMLAGIEIPKFYSTRIEKSKAKLPRILVLKFLKK